MGSMTAPWWWKTRLAESATLTKNTARSNYKGSEKWRIISLVIIRQTLATHLSEYSQTSSIIRTRSNFLRSARPRNISITWISSDISSKLVSNNISWTKISSPKRNFTKTGSKTRVKVWVSFTSTSTGWTPLRLFLTQMNRASSTPNRRNKR